MDKIKNFVDSLNDKDFLSMNYKVDYDKIKSITDVDIIWVEEVNEIAEDGYEEIKRRLRISPSGDILTKKIFGEIRF